MELMTPQEWLDEAAWEGGILLGFDYGLTSEDLSDDDPEFVALVRSAEGLARDYLEAEAALLDYADENGYEVES